MFRVLPLPVFQVEEEQQGISDFYSGNVTRRQWQMLRGRVKGLYDKPILCFAGRVQDAPAEQRKRLHAILDNIRLLSHYWCLDKPFKNRI